MSGAAETDTQAAAAANTSGITPDSISATLKEKLDASHVDINDISGTTPPLCSFASLFVMPLSNEKRLTSIPTGGCGQAFEAMIVSTQFAKKTTLARHRLVNSALKEEIAAIHAWTPKCLTPEEWEKRQGGS